MCDSIHNIGGGGSTFSRKGEDIVKPKCVIDYNKVKNGFDFSDQMS